MTMSDQQPSFKYHMLFYSDMNILKSDVYEKSEKGGILLEKNQYPPGLDNLLKTVSQNIKKYEKIWFDSNNNELNRTTHFYKNSKIKKTFVTQIESNDYVLVDTRWLDPYLPNGHINNVHAHFGWFKVKH